MFPPEIQLDVSLLMERITAGVVVHALDTRIVYANPRALSLLRLTWEQALGRQALQPEWDLLDETGRVMEVAEYPVNRVLNSGKPVTELVLGIRDFDDPLPTWVVVNAFLDQTQAVHQIVVTFSDISQLHRLPFREIVDQAHDAVLVCNASPIDLPDGPRIVYVNDMFCRLTGYSRDEVIGKTPRILQGEQTDRAALNRIREALSSQQAVRETLVNYTKAGKPYWLDISIFPLHEYGGTVTHFAAIERDVTALKQAELAHRDAAQLDALTGLLNRRGFDALADGELHALRASRQGYAIIAIDIDHFKRINDQYGHAAGDLVLRELALLLGSISRKDDLCARFGGEEFVMLLPGADEKEALQVAERLRSQAAKLLVGTDLLRFTLSAGVATDSMAQDLPRTLIAGDAALYRAKALGRNCVQLFV